MNVLRVRSRARLLLLGAALLALAAVTVPWAAAGGERSTCAATTVNVSDHARYAINRYILDAMRFAPGAVTIKSGCTLTFSFATAGQDEGHSLSIVAQPDLPKTSAQIENCTVCKQIAAKHVKHAGQPPGPNNPVVHWIVNVGRPGLDAPGDSIVIDPSEHKRVTIAVSAPAGKILYFMCGLHPWMQGKIIVK